MRVAIHNPTQLTVRANHTLYAYVIEYVRRHRPLIYLTDEKAPPRYFWWPMPRLTPDGIIAQLHALGIEYDRSMIITDVVELNRRADVLTGFSGEYFIHPPERRFHGMKVYHTQDFQAYCRMNHRALRAAGVDRVFCTGQLDKYSALFRETYPTYIGKVVSFPFGYATRFKDKTSWNRRLRKAFVTGSINPTSITRYPTGEKLVTEGNKVVHRPTTPLERLKYWVYYHVLIRASTRDYERHYRDQEWFHPFRRMLVEHAREVRDIVTLRLPVYPQVKKFDFDLVAELNRHQLAVVDDGNIEIIGAKAYEAAACGCAVVCPRMPWYREFGFIDGKTCIMYRENDLADFRRQVERCLANPVRLRRVRDAGQRMVVRKYNHAAIAEMIHRRIGRTYRTWVQERRPSKSRL